MKWMRVLNLDLHIDTGLGPDTCAKLKPTSKFGPNMGAGSGLRHVLRPSLGPDVSGLNHRFGSGPRARSGHRPKAGCSLGF